MLCDAHGRTISYLRLSVTDRCDMRCRYCMPEGPPCASSRPVLNFEEIARIVRILVGLGVTRVRLTGGEPLLRRGLASLSGALAAVDGLEGIALTTNGVHLRRHARHLAAAGVSAVNIHLDSLSPLAHRWIAGGDFLDDVRGGIEAALSAGFRSVKLNAVLLRGVNDGELFDLVRFAASRGVPIRFIELMPMGGRAFFEKHFLASAEAIDRLNSRWTLKAADPPAGGGPARYYRVEEIGADIGFIGHSRERFCDDCNRIRLLADGTLKNCLGARGELPLAGNLNRMDDGELSRLIRDFVRRKPAGHGGFADAASERGARMHAIGG